VLVQVSVATGMSWEETLRLPWLVLETDLDVMAKGAEK
jgi:hypothetical protein